MSRKKRGRASAEAGESVGGLGTCQIVTDDTVFEIPCISEKECRKQALKAGGDCTWTPSADCISENEG